MRASHVVFARGPRHSYSSAVSRSNVTLDRLSAAEPARRRGGAAAAMGDSRESYAATGLRARRVRCLASTASIGEKTGSRPGRHGEGSGSTGPSSRTRGHRARPRRAALRRRNSVAAAPVYGCATRATITAQLRACPRGPVEAQRADGVAAHSDSSDDRERRKRDEGEDGVVPLDCPREAVRPAREVKQPGARPLPAEPCRLVLCVFCGHHVAALVRQSVWPGRASQPSCLMTSRSSAEASSTGRCVAFRARRPATQGLPGRWAPTAAPTTAQGPRCRRRELLRDPQEGTRCIAAPGRHGASSSVSMPKVEISGRFGPERE